MSKALKRILTDKSARNQQAAAKIVHAEAKAGHPWCC